MPINGAGSKFIIFTWYFERVTKFSEQCCVLIKVHRSACGEFFLSHGIYLG
jgi:hypothetical protein